MNADNPYSVTPSLMGDRSDGDHKNSAGEATVAEVSSRILEILNQTRPWVRLMGVLLWIGTVLLGLASIGLMVGGLFAQNTMFLVVSGVYTLMTVVYAVLARSLTTYASKISLLNDSGSVRDLEDALEAQKTFWKLVGMITVACLVLYVLMLVLMFSGVLMMGNMNRH